MAILQYGRFENHMDGFSSETLLGDKYITEVCDDDPYDDGFDDRLSQIDNALISRSVSNDCTGATIKHSAYANGIFPKRQEHIEESTNDEMNISGSQLPKSDRQLTTISQEHTTDVSDDSLVRHSTGRLHQSISQISEKVIAAASVFDSISDLLSGGTVSIVTPSKITVEDIIYSNFAPCKTTTKCVITAKRTAEK